MLWLFFNLAHADLPLPIYPECGEIDRPDLCPSDMGERWNLISYVQPHARESVRPAELILGSGNHVDRAFRLSTGRFDVRLAFIDSGFRWDHNDLKNKFFLNRAELPLPQDINGNTAPDYDFNQDGLFNLQDYAEDPRVDISAGVNGDDSSLDVSDLLAVFSDGVDDDENGYVDDISGWDFFNRDNDPYHTNNEGEYGTHGTGVLREAAGEGGNGSGIGVCPNCAAIPLRVGDSFISDGGRVAEAISYAADMQASAATLAIGALSNSEATTAAVEYAIDMGVSLVGAAGDENSFHHNFPAALDNILYVHSLSFNTADDDMLVYSYMNTWNCNNFGARMDFVAASHACATGSVAQITGAIGLMQSLALDLELTLTPLQIRQILRRTVTDVWLTLDEQRDSRSYPSAEGWDPFYGYGRVNVGDALHAISVGEIPIGMSIQSPSWFEMVDLGQKSNVRFAASLSNPSLDGIQWTLEMGYGLDPREWDVVGNGTSSDEEIEIDLTIDLSNIPITEVDEGDYWETIAERLERVNEPSVTFRLRAIDPDGVDSELRRTFNVRQDSDLIANFPIEFSGSLEASPVLADMDSDGIFEIIIGDGSGYVHVIDGSGNPFPGWPVATPERVDLADSPAFRQNPPVRDLISGGVAVGDIEGDGTPEVIGVGIYGGIYAWRSDGTLVNGFPAQTIGREPHEFDAEHTYDQGIAGAPTLYDLDGDGVLEIIVMGLDSRLYVIGPNGEDWGPYPIELCHETLCGVAGFRSINSPSVGDVDGDGQIEIGVGTNEAVNNGRDSVSYLFDAVTGVLEPDWPHTQQGLLGIATLLPLIGEGHPSSLAYADIDGDGDLEIASPVMLGMVAPVHHNADTALNVSFYGSDFHEDSNADVPSLIQMISNPSWGDLNLDGVPDFVMSGVSSVYLASIASRTVIEYQQGVGAWDGATGEIFPGWPRQIEDVQFLSAPAIADVSGDEYPEVIAVSGGFLMHAWDKDGIEAPGWPKFTGGWMIGSPAVGDINGDGYLDVVVGTREGWLYAFSTQGSAAQDVQWSGMHHDAQNTGNHSHPIPSQVGVTMEEATGCCGSNGDKSAGLLALPLVLFACRRRRS